ncbi:SDR family NAD(P)-dependent oxidoreductase [Sphingobacterium sp. LRF_L2]|uniref:SDR family NAD(P)-dependent oxidoreductase n=1 Tax=Sphingobacterium sp. LRF_L2 TaxID=3369421 RepID=UPI003F613474
MNTEKIALVTGGSRGIGRDIAIKLAEKGNDVVITYNQNREKAEEVVTQIQAIGQKCWALSLDTRQVKDFDSFIQQVISQIGGRKIDYLVNNAGTAMYQNIEGATEEQVSEIFDIHYKGVFFLTQKVLPYIPEGGAIVNISSGLTRMTQVGSSIYASAKAAVEVLTRYQAKEFSSKKIRVNVVAPGAIETDFGGGRTRDNKEINAHIAGITALGRVGLPQDIGVVVAFLCSEESSWITGQRIEVSGGMML